MKARLALIYFGKDTGKATVRIYDSTGRELEHDKCLMMRYCLSRHLGKVFDSKLIDELIKTLESKDDEAIHEFKNKHEEVIKIRDRKGYKKILISLDTKHINRENYKDSIYNKLIRL